MHAKRAEEEQEGKNAARQHRIRDFSQGALNGRIADSAQDARPNDSTVDARDGAGYETVSVSDGRGIREETDDQGAGHSSACMDDRVGVAMVEVSRESKAR